MLQARGPGPTLGVDTLGPWIDAEWALFLLFVRIETKVMSLFYAGQPFAQLMHDGGTPKNHNKYQSIAKKFVRPFKLAALAKLFKELLSSSNNMTSLEDVLESCSFRRRLLLLELDPRSLSLSPVNLALSWVRCIDGSASVVADLVRMKWEEATGFPFEETCVSSVQDWAAMKTASELDLYLQGCEMHHKDKVPGWASGVMTRSRNKVCIGDAQYLSVCYELSAFP